MKVFKFGGASVKDADSVRNVASVLGLYSEDKIAVVVSAKQVPDVRTATSAGEAVCEFLDFPACVCHGWVSLK